MTHTTTTTETFLRQMYGDSQGFAILTTISFDSTRERIFEYPRQAAEMASAASELAAGADVYYCTTLRSTASRKLVESECVAAVWIHADVDGRVELAPDLLPEAYIVGSGTPGHGHVYLKVTEALSANEFRQLGRGLRDHLRAAGLDVDNKVAANDILRIPGTLNHKTDPATDVAVILEWSGYEYDVDDLADKLGVILTDDSYVLDVVSDLTPEAVEMSQYVRGVVETEQGDRSAHACDIINAAIAEGYSKSQALWCVLQSAECAERYVEKPSTCANEIHKFYANSTVVQGRSDWDLLTSDMSTTPLTAPAIPDSSAGSSSWAPIDLEAFFAGDVEVLEPTMFVRTDGSALIYPGKTHSFQGETESGKSLVVQSICVEQIKRGNDVLYLDFEDSANGVIPRMIEMGATKTELLRHLRYVRPRESTQSGAQGFEALLSNPYAFAVIDGVTETMSLEGLNSDKDADVAQWQKRIANRIADDTGAGVASVDHVVKNTDSRGRMALGSQHKMSGLSGASYTVEPDMQNPIGRGKRGTIIVRLAKDRVGTVQPVGDYRSDRTREAARVIIDSTTPGRSLVTVAMPDLTNKVEGRSVTADDEIRALISNLLSNKPAGVNKGAISALIGKRSGPTGKQIDAMEALGYVEFVNGPRRRVDVKLIRPYGPESDVLLE